jgi:UDP-N-acetyl-D-galactosamine dehydrogenase
LTKIVKVVSGQDQETLERVATTYNKIIEAGVYKASSIKVAEAAKVIENTQRDLNIALVNELAIIFERMGIATQDVLDAAGTKWNFLKFKPGLVGGHCIGVDPYYLTYRAEELGLHPQVITAGRRINDSMAGFVAQKAVKLMLSRGISPASAKVGILGLTFKENVNDIRNSKVPAIIKELREFGIEALIYDPWADKEEVLHEYGLSLAEESELSELDALIFAVPHDVLMVESATRITSKLRSGGVLVDVKAALKPQILPSNTLYWSL